MGEPPRVLGGLPWLSEVEPTEFGPWLSSVVWALRCRGGSGRLSYTQFLLRDFRQLLQGISRLQRIFRLLQRVHDLRVSTSSVPDMLS
jgi:hypothetical protein